MKRSEMLSYLTKIIGSSGALMGSSHVDEAALAEDVLSAVEEQGMLPPVLNEESFKIAENGEMIYAVNEWEDEEKTNSSKD